MNNQNRKNSLKKFLLISAAMFFGWLLLYESYLKHLGQPDAFLTLLTAQAGQHILTFLGYFTSATLSEEGVLLSIEGTPLLQIADNCNGLSVLVLFSAIVLLLPGRPLQKLWYIPLCIATLFTLNALRVAALVITQIHHPQWLDFNHKYTFTVVIYLVVFLLWMGWGKLQKLKSPKWQEEKLQVS